MPATAKTGIIVEIRDDGVYLVITRKVTRKEILEVVEGYKIQDIDFVALNSIFKSTDSFLERKISSNKKIFQEDEKLTITVSKDRQEAFIKFTAPVNGGAFLTIDSIKEAVAKSNVVHGIDESLFQKLLKGRIHEYTYPLAKGTLPIDGVNGYLEFFFDRDNNNLTPKLLDDGTVDFRSLNVLKMCYAGFNLVSAVPPVEGADGIDVTGRIIKHRKGKPAPPLPRGKNVVLNEEGNTLIAHINGQILYAQNKINISPVYEVKGNVDNSTGNINFNGSVLIKGNVLTGFKVKAAENIEVLGVLEGGSLSAGANILLHSGAQGMGKAEIKAAGDINAKYIESCKVEAGRNIVTSSLMHSNVSCGGNLRITGKRALLVGGKIKATGSITAGIIGSQMATQTELEVGHDPAVLEEFKTISAKFNEKRKVYENNSKEISLLRAMDAKSPLLDRHKAILLSALHTKQSLEEQLKDLNELITNYKQLLDTYEGVISVEKVIHCGVNILIGNAALYVRDDIFNCSLVNENGKIIIKKYTIVN